MPPRTRKPKPTTVEVDAAALAFALIAIAINVAPNTVTPAQARALLNLEHDLTRSPGVASTGILDIGWGLRAGDDS